MPPIFKYDNPSRMQFWISHALRHDLEVFQVIFTGGITFPCSLLCSTSLRRLELRFYNENILNVVPKNYAPNLTSLYLFKVEVKAPRLLKFGCSYGLREQIILDGSSSIISAALHGDGYLALSNTDGLQIRSLLNKFTNLKDLEISCLLVRVSQLSSSICCLNSLKHLALTDECTTKELFELLHLTPSLKSLSLNKVVAYQSMEHVPSCISQLDAVEFRHSTMLNLARFMMEKGDQLKRISIFRHDGSPKPEAARQILLTFPKSSPCLIIDVRQ